jgi:glycosyltransferase involved in cell wall biosynthesis
VARDRGGARVSASPMVVSVVIPAFNAAATIGRALQSVVAQSFAPVEIIVVDDGCTDATGAIVSSYADRDVRLIRFAGNSGVSVARNAGIAAARGEYVAFLDADDAWLPDKLARQVAVLGANPKATLSTCACKIFKSDGSLRREFGFPPAYSDKGEIWRLLLAATHIHTSCVVARRAALAAVGPFDVSVVPSEDQDMWIRLAMLGDAEFVPDCLVDVFEQPGSLTVLHAANADRYELEVVRRHIAARRHQLSKAEIRHILATRYAAIGRKVYGQGRSWRRSWQGASLLLRAGLLSGDGCANLFYIVRFSRPAIMVKRLIRKVMRASS